MAELTVDQKKKRNNRIILIVVILLFLVLGTWGAIKIFGGKKKKDLAKGDTKAEDKKEPAKAKEPVADEFPLQKGSKGDNVKYLQTALNRLMPVGYTPLVVDGVFGPLTYSAVITWMGTKYYPVTQVYWIDIVKKGNAVPAGPAGGGGPKPAPSSNV